MRRDSGPPAASSVEHQCTVGVHRDPLVCLHGQRAMRTDVLLWSCGCGRVVYESGVCTAVHVLQECASVASPLPRGAPASSSSFSSTRNGRSRKCDRSRNWPKSKMTEVEIGRSRIHVFNVCVCASVCVVCVLCCVVLCCVVCRVVLWGVLCGVVCCVV